MISLNFIYFLFSFAFIFLLPGYLMAYRYSRGFNNTNAVEIFALITGFSTLVVPSLIFFVASFTFLPIKPLLALCGSFSLVILQYRQLGGALSDLSSFFSTGRWRIILKQILAPAITAAFALVYQVLFFDTVNDLDFSCTYFPCAISAGLVDFEGSEGINFNLLFGDHQRMGITSVLSPAMALYGMFGLRVQWGLILSVIPLCVFILSQRIGTGKSSAGIAMIISAILPCIIFEPDQNRLVLSLICFFTLIVIIRQERPLFLGGMLALLLGAEPFLILGLPSLIVGLLRKRNPSWRLPSNWLKMALSFFVFSVPFLIRYTLAFGNPFLLHEHFSYIPSLDYSLFDMQFTIPAFLNWPLFDQLVRSTYNPLPNLVILPITIEAHFGVLLLSVACIGVLALAIEGEWHVLSTMALFFVPIAGFLALNENWTQKDKWGVVVMAYLPIFLCLASGFSWFTRERKLLIHAAIFSIVAFAMVLSHKLLININAPEDSRFQSYWSENIQKLPPEDPFYLEVESRSLRRIKWLPNFFSFHGIFPFHGPKRLNLKALFRQCASLSLRERDLTTMELFPLLFMSEEWHAIIPEGIDRVQLMLKYAHYPAVSLIDLSEPPYFDIDPDTISLTHRKDCPPLGKTLDLYPFTLPIPVTVSWSEGPILIALGISEAEGYSVLMMVRTVLRFDEERLFGKKSLDVSCLRLHLPDEQEIILVDFYSLDPLRNYVFRVESDEDA